MKSPTSEVATVCIFSSNADSRILGAARSVIRPPGRGSSPPGAVDPEQQRIAQEAEAARTSHLFTTNTRERPAAPDG
jgi:hypothetical protein